MLKRAFLCLSCMTILGLSSGNSATDAKLSSSANCFTLDFYKLLAKKPGNLVSSPFSLDVLLSMLLVGAGGQTAQELTKALGYQGLSTNDLQDSFRTKLGQLQSSGNNTLEVANSVWIQQNFEIIQSYKDAVVKNFLSEITNVDFSGNPHQATAQINSWGSDRTNGLIPKLYEQDLDPSTIMVLVNAIYFKGQWKLKFEKSLTTDEDFKNDGSATNSKKVQMMHQVSNFKYNEDNTLNVQVLEMDYAGNDMSMVIILPRDGTSLNSVESAINCQAFLRTISSTYNTLVDVTLPKYEVESTFDLRQPIQESGIVSAFSDSADFSGIANGIKVTSAIQKAIIKVYEEGSEAAVLTGIAGGAAGSVDQPDPSPVVFRADRPFLFLIRHKPSDLVLFLGRVSSF